MRWIYQRQQQFLLPLFCTIASLCLTLMMYNRYCGLFFLLSLSSYFCCLDSTDMTLLDLSHTLRCLKLDRYMGFIVWVIYMRPYEQWYSLFGCLSLTDADILKTRSDWIRVLICEVISCASACLLLTLRAVIRVMSRDKKMSIFIQSLSFLFSSPPYK